MLEGSQRLPELASFQFVPILVLPIIFNPKSPNSHTLHLFLLFISSSSSFKHISDTIGVGVGVGNGGGGGVVWVGGGVNNPQPSGSSSESNLDGAYTALQAWKYAITDDPKKILGTWVGPNVCSYKGVFCDFTEDEICVFALAFPVVASIDLNHANFQGTLVKELSLLTDMSLFHLNSNSYFSETIPQELFYKNLDALFLNNNQFEGEIPHNLGNFPASVINLANNKLSGNIPASFGFMGSKLKEILFLNNQLTGCIPEGVGLFTEIQVLDVSYNTLMGHVPDTLSCLQDIQVLNLAHNKLSGQLSDVICSLRSLAN